MIQIFRFFFVRLSMFAADFISCFKLFFRRRSSALILLASSFSSFAFTLASAFSFFKLSAFNLSCSIFCNSKSLLEAVKTEYDVFFIISMCWWSFWGRWCCQEIRNAQLPFVQIFHGWRFIEDFRSIFVAMELVDICRWTQFSFYTGVNHIRYICNANLKIFCHN